MTAGRVACRRATIDDLGVVDRLARDLHVLHHAAWPDVFATAGPAGRDDAHWRASIEGAGCAGFLAERDGTAVGFITAAIAEESGTYMQPMRFARVNSVCVLESERRFGIGRTLMACAEDWARTQGAVDLRLTVFNFNARALRLYEDLGYVARSTAMGKRLVDAGGAAPDHALPTPREGTFR